MTQLQMIDKTKSIAQQDTNVSAIFMYGSFTKGEGDKYSDIEFYIFLKSRDDFLAEKWVNQIHPVALCFTNEYGSEVAIFNNLVRGEFHFLTTKEIEIIKSWEGMVAWGASLLNVLLTTSNLIKRGEFAHAHQSLSNVQKYLLWLTRITTNKTQHWESPTKSLEKDIDSTWYSEYITVTSDLQPENIRSSFENSLKLTENLFEKLNVESKLKEILNRIS